tara:strand:- start:5059 stop:5469 length:411 start_codon:yes stop_codon:yes gene_type:complete
VVLRSPQEVLDSVVLGDSAVLVKGVLALKAHEVQVIRQDLLHRFLQVDFRVLLSQRLLVEGFALVVLMEVQKVVLMEVQTGVHLQVLGWEVHVLEALVKGVPVRVAHAVFHRHSHPLHLGCLGQPWRCKVWAHLSN